MEKNRGKRKRGGQPGNQNARTHGNYSTVATPQEMGVLESVAGLGLHGKRLIFGELLAYFIARHPELFESRSSPSVPEKVERIARKFLSRARKPERIADNRAFPQNDAACAANGSPLSTPEVHACP
jgi:hypothetical protein